MYLWKPPSNTITSSNTKEGGSANLYLEMTSRSPLSELNDRISIVLTTSKCRTYLFNDLCCWTKWDKLLPHTPQTLSIQPPTEIVLTSREAMNFRTPRQLLCTAEHMSIHPYYAIKLFLELPYTTVLVSKNRSMIQFRCCRDNDYVILTIKLFFELLLRTMAFVSKNRLMIKFQCCRVYDCVYLTPWKLKYSSYILFLAPLINLGNGTNTRTPTTNFL